MIWKSVVLGTVQGLTEFLPVSSSGHLTLLQRILGYDLGGGSMTFVNVMLHFGTLIAVVCAFWKDVLAIFQKPFKSLFYLLLATVPAGIVGLLFHGRIDQAFSGEHGLLYLAICFASTALLLLATELVAKRRKAHAPFKGKHAICMGLMQAVALFPGISRSGSTIAAGTLSGADAQEVAKFSFLMSIPIILGSAAISLKEVVFDQPQAVTAMGGVGFLGVLLGIACSAVFGFLSIRFMLKLIAKANYKWFSLYLVALSLACVWLDVINIFPA